MDLNSYIQLKEAYSQVGKPQQLTESVDSIWEEVEAFAHALVEEEGMDLSDMTWDEVHEAYLEERMGRVSNSSQNTSGQAAQNAAKLARTAAANTKRQNATGQGGQSIASNPNRRGVQPAKRPADMQKGKVYGDASPSPSPVKPAPTQTAKPKPQVAKAAPSPMISDLKKRMPKPAAPKPAAPKPSGSSLTGNRASSFMSKSGGAAAAAKAPKPSASPIKSNRLRAALDSVKKEEFSEFDLILSHLIEQGFGDDEALKLMVNMSEEKREEILMMSEGEQPNIEYLNRYGGHPEVKSKKKKKTPFEKENPGHSDDKPTARFTKADREEMLAAKKEASAKVTAAANKARKTQKEETDSLYQAYLSMMSEEECDKRKDKHLESGGHAAKTDYSKPPATGNDFGKKKPMSDEDRSAAMAKIVAKMKKQGGK